MQCERCNFNNVERAKYCSNCGGRLVTETSSDVKLNTRLMCLSCKGKGMTRSIWRIVIGIIMSTCFFCGGVFASVFEIGIVLFLFSISIVFVIWGFKGKTCEVCKGSGYYYS